ncbi:unnamed protein product, partial [marine sediment metagenome]
RQIDFNRRHNITPKSIQKQVRSILDVRKKNRQRARELMVDLSMAGIRTAANTRQAVAQLKRQMVQAARNLEFELAALYRDKIVQLEKELHPNSGLRHRSDSRG